jgi:hypothetical protein
MARHTAAESSNGFDEFWAGGGARSGFGNAAEYADDLASLIPESVTEDPGWHQLAHYGVGIREAAAMALPELAGLHGEAIDEELADILSGMSEAQMEGFFDFLKNTARSALQVAAPLAGAAGRILGTAIGGPVGTMVGGMAGDLLGQGAQALDRHLGRGGQRRGRGRRGQGGGRRGRRQSRGGFGQVFNQFAPTVQAGARALVSTAAPAVSRLGQQLQNPAAGMALGQAAGQQIAQVAGQLSGLINSQEMQLALSNAAAGLPADIANAEGMIADASLLTAALREAIIEAADILETIEVAEAVPFGSGELAEFVGG